MHTIKNNQTEWIRCGIAPENEEIWQELLNMPKWKKKPKSAIDLSIKKLSFFDSGFQKELIERAIAGNYQGVVFSNTLKEYENYKKNVRISKISRFERIINNNSI